MVATCESGLHPDAISPDGQNVGLLQVNLVHGYSAAWLLVPENNIEAAHKIWLDSGWIPWACKPW